MALQTNVIRSWPLGSAVSKVKKDMMTAANTIKPKSIYLMWRIKYHQLDPLSFQQLI